MWGDSGGSLLTDKGDIRVGVISRAKGFDPDGTIHRSSWDDGKRHSVRSCGYIAVISTPAGNPGDS